MTTEQLAFRTDNAIMQLQRYGRALEDELLVSTLEKLTDINDNMANGIVATNTVKQSDMAIAYLQTLKGQLK